MQKLLSLLYCCTLTVNKIDVLITNVRIARFTRFATLTISVSSKVLGLLMGSGGGDPSAPDFYISFSIITQKKLYFGLNSAK